MNSAHMEFCASAAWRELVMEQVLPLALDGVTLGDHTIEIGPGPGFTTDVLHTMTGKLTAVELDAGLAASLTERLAGTNVEVVVGDATNWNSLSRCSPAVPRFTCFTTFQPPKPRIGPSPSWPVSW